MKTTLAGAALLGVRFGGVGSKPLAEVVAWNPSSDDWTHFHVPVSLDEGLALARALVEKHVADRPAVVITVEIADP
jgi:hypothetical protein